MLQDDDTNSDSGLEPESPITRRKLFNVSSVKHTGMYICMYVANYVHNAVFFDLAHAKDNNYNYDMYGKYSTVVGKYNTIAMLECIYKPYILCSFS